MDTNSAIGQAIRSARLSLGLTGSDVRRLAGIDPTSLSFIERGKREPSLDHIRRLAKALDLDPVTLAAAALKPARRRSR